MAKKKENKNKSNKDLMKEFMEISNKVDKEMSLYGGSVDSSIYSSINEYIHTGSYALNRLITGNIYNGVPSGRVVGFAGPSGTGKSYMCGQVIKHAQQMGYFVIHYDTEATNLKEFLTNIGCDTESVLSFHPDSIEGFRNHAINSCKELKKNNPELKLLIILDSYGGLSCAKEIRDVAEGKDNSDMGSRAKAGASMFKEMTRFCGKQQIPFLYTNHVYEKPGATPFLPSTLVQTGGNKPTYLSSAVIFMSKKKEKDANKSVIGNILKMRSEKNRLCPEAKIVEMYLSFKTGPSPYYGIIDDAVSAGLAEQVDKKNYKIKHLNDEKIHVSKLYTTRKEDVFTDEFLDKLNEYCVKEYSYASDGNLDNIIDAINGDDDGDDDADE